MPLPVTMTLVTLFELLPIGYTVAQVTKIVCLPSFDWMTNSEGQNPCLVSAYLAGACIAGSCTVDPLHPPAHDRYLGPTADEQNDCQCSSVTYNTFSACAICQNGTVVNWSKWNLNCLAAYPGIFPPGVPNGTAVPQWAFQDVTTSDRFNLKLAEVVGDTPESTATQARPTSPLSSANTAISTYPATGSATLALTSDPSPVSLMTTQSAITSTMTPVSSTASGGSPNKDEIIIIGCVSVSVGVALIVLAYFVVQRIRKLSVPQPVPPDAAYTSFDLLGTDGV